MADDFAKVLARDKHALVVAPAGCGKTHLISEATLHCTGRQTDSRDSERVRTVDGLLRQVACLGNGG